MNESLSFLSSKCLNVNNINWGSPYNTLNKERSELFRDLESNKELVLQESMATFERDELLGKNIEVAIVIKRSNQLERDEYTKNIELNLANGSIKTGLRGSDKSTRYHDGFFIKTNLDDDFLDIDCNSIYTTLKQPTGFASNHKNFIVGAGNNLVLLDKKTLAVNGTIQNDWFARLHTVECSPDNSQILTVASSYDTIFEIDYKSGNVLWEMCPWGQGYNINAQGELVTKKQMPDELNQNNVLLVNDPNSYNGMGLPTSKTPNHINGVTYDRNGNILATVFHRGELWSIDKNSKQVSILLNGLGHPHAIKQDSLFRNGYIITDTNDESVIFLDSNYQPKYKLFTSDFDGKRQGLEKERWLQHTEKIADNLYCTIDMPRRKVFLFDPINKIYRDLSFNPNWAIQLISAIN